MIIGAIYELLFESQPAMSFYEDLLGARLADVRYHDLVLNTLEGAVRQREWKSLDPGLISAELLLSRHGPGNGLVPGLELPAVRRRAFARIRSASRRGDRARPVSDPGGVGRNSEMDAQMGGFARQRETGQALRDPQPRLDFSDGTPRDEYFTVMRFEGQELGWFRKEMGREVFRLTSPTGRSLEALLVPDSDAFVVRSEDMLRAYDAALDRRCAQFDLDLEGFRKDVGASREVILHTKSCIEDPHVTVLLMGYFAPRVRGDAIKFGSRGKTAAKGRSR